MSLIHPIFKRVFFKKRPMVEIFIDEGFNLSEDLITWLQQAQFKPNAKECVWQFINQKLNLNTIPASIFAEHDNVKSSQKIMRADPVCLQAGWHGLVVVDNKPSLSLAEAEALALDINQDLTGLKLHCPEPNRWYLSGDSLDDFTSLPTHCTKDKLTHLVQDLPKNLHRQLNQIQINLHSHQVNQARIKQGLKPVNSLWCWGLSEAKTWRKLKKFKLKIFTNNAEIKIYATSLGVECQAINNFEILPHSVLILDESCDNFAKIDLALLAESKQIFYRGAVYR